MAFRIVLSIALAASLLNLELVFHVAKANPIEKAFLILAAVLYCVERRKERVALLLVGAIVVTAAGAALLSQYPLFTWDRFLRSLTSLLAFLLLLCAWPTATDRRFVLHLVAFAPLVAVLLGVAYEFAGLRRLWEIDFLGATRLAGSVGPAFLGAFAASGATAAAFLYGEDRRLAPLALVAGNIAIAVLSGSRMAFAVAAATAGLVLLLQSRGFLFRFVVVVYGTSALAAFVLVFGDQIVARLLSNSFSGRQLIWQELWGWVDRYPWFGTGLGHQMDLLSAQASMLTHTIAAHNEYLRFIVELGFAGASLFALLFLALVVTLLRSPLMQRPAAFACACCGFLVFSLTDNTFSVPECFLLLIAAQMGAARTTDPVATAPSAALVDVPGPRPQAHGAWPVATATREP